MTQTLEAGLTVSFEDKPVHELAKMMRVNLDGIVKVWFESNDIDVDALIVTKALSEPKAMYLYNLHNVFKFISDSRAIDVMNYLSERLQDTISASNGNFNHEDPVSDNLLKCISLIQTHLYVSLNSTGAPEVLQANKEGQYEPITPNGTTH